MADMTAVSFDAMAPAETKPSRNYLGVLILGSGGLLTLGWIGLLGRGALWLIGY